MTPFLCHEKWSDGIRFKVVDRNSSNFRTFTYLGYMLIRSLITVGCITIKEFRMVFRAGLRDHARGMSRDFRKA
jgi:hypothetical protein